MKISKIISGGQTGADRGGLDAAIHCKLDYGGWIPKGRKAEDGPIPAAYVSLVEMSSADYLKRTEANVADSDATIVLTYGPPVGGSKRTIDFAVKHGRPWLAVDLNNERKDVVDQIVRWLDNDCPGADGVLNVAGSRESKQPWIGVAVKVRIVDVVSKVNGKLFYPMRG